MVVCFTNEEVTIKEKESFLEKEGRRSRAGTPVGSVEQRESDPSR